MAGRCVAASILLRLSADPSAKDAGGNIPLHYAAVGRRGLAVERRGPNVRNNAGKTPVDSADCPGGNVSFRGCYVWGLASAFSCLWSALATAGIEP